MADKLTPEQVAEFKEAFSVFDEDGGGSIETSELKDLFRKLGHEVSDEEIKEIVDEYDADGNGQIDFSEFLDMMSRQMQGASRSEFLTEAFKALVDAEDPTHITVQSLKKAFDDAATVEDAEVTVRQIQKMVKDVGGASDSTLTFAEFKAVYLQLEKSLG